MPLHLPGATSTRAGFMSDYPIQSIAYIRLPDVLDAPPTVPNALAAAPAIQGAALEHYADAWHQDSLGNTGYGSVYLWRHHWRFWLYGDSNTCRQPCNIPSGFVFQMRSAAYGRVYCGIISSSGRLLSMAVKMASTTSSIETSASVPMRTSKVVNGASSTGRRTYLVFTGICCPMIELLLLLSIFTKDGSGPIALSL